MLFLFLGQEPSTSVGRQVGNGEPTSKMSADYDVLEKSTTGLTEQGNGDGGARYDDKDQSPGW
jgi:hypothetical protein